DNIVLDVPNRSLRVDMDDDELNAREVLASAASTFAAPKRGYERLYIDHVLQADTGADLDFLVGSSGSGVGRESH
ncbi:MAG: dihydroxy-acid dehydratase, partial [Propionibacteriaceae bacterium]|nr:dihydroxy-acid dehydratase [Propionibacteriaceae bacterium]